MDEEGISEPDGREGMWMGEASKVKYW